MPIPDVLSEIKNLSEMPVKLKKGINPDFIVNIFEFPVNKRDILPSLGRKTI